MSKFLKEGLLLLNKGWDLYLISLGFGLISLFLGNYSEHGGGWVAGLVSFLMLYLSMIYSILSPLFFKDKQQGVKTSIPKIAKLVLKHSIKLIIPSILFFLLMIFIIVFLFFFSAILVKLANPSINMENLFSQLGSGFSQPFNLYLLVITFICFPLTFFSIYYAVEGKGVLSALKNSFKSSFKHLQFIFVINALYYILNSLTFYLPEKDLWARFLMVILSNYILLWLYTTTTLIYYQKKIASK